VTKQNAMLNSSHAAIILASDFGGFDEPPPSSAVDPLLQAFKQTDIRFHSILFQLNSKRGQNFQEIRKKHNELAQTASGTTKVGDSLLDVDAQLAAIATALRTEYSASYPSEAQPGAWLDVAIAFAGAQKSAQGRAPCRAVPVKFAVTGLNGLANIADGALDWTVEAQTRCGIKQVVLAWAYPETAFTSVYTWTQGDLNRWPIRTVFFKDTNVAVRAAVLDDEDKVSISNPVNVTFLPPFSVSVSTQQDIEPTWVRFNVTSTYPVSYAAAVMSGPIVLESVIQNANSTNPVVLFERPGGFWGAFSLQGQVTFQFEDQYRRRVSDVKRDVFFGALPSVFTDINRAAALLALLMAALILLLLRHWQRGLVITRSITLANSGNAPARFALRAYTTEGYRVGLSGAKGNAWLRAGSSWYQTPEVAPAAEGVVLVSLRRFLWGLRANDVQVQLQSAVLSTGSTAAQERSRDTRARLVDGDLNAWQTREPVLVALPDRRWFWWAHLLQLLLLLTALAVAIYLAFADENSLRGLLHIAR
jgi:hypothetical protein